MKYLLLVLVLMGIAAPIHACEIKGTQGLDEVTIQKLKLACEEAKLVAQQALVVPTAAVASSAVQTVKEAVTAENISAFGQASRDVAKAIGLAASELGLAVNEFLRSPAGILTVTVVLWKMFGLQMLGLFLCGLTLVIAFWFVKRATVSEYTMVEKRRFWGLYTVTKRVPTYATFKEMDDSQGLSIGATVVVTLLLLWIFLGNLVV